MLLLSLAFAADPVTDALEEELTRAMESLALDDAPRPYFIAYRLHDTWDVAVEASLGGIVSESVEPRRSLGVEVRVGSPEYDSANFKAGFSSDNGMLSRSIVLADVPLAIRKDAWLVTDEAYKHAVANLSAKEAADARRAEIDPTPDYTLPGPFEAEAESAPRADLAELRTLAEQVSARFADHPGVELSKVDARARSGRAVVLDSEGTHVSTPIQTTDIVLEGRTRAEDGSRTTASRTVRVRSVDRLPDPETLDRAVEDLATTLGSWAGATVPEDPYIGPVVVEGRAAARLFQNLLLPALEGTPQPEKPAKGSRMFTFGRGGDDGTVLGLKRRILPAGWSVVDDPKSDPASPAWRTHDDEGTPVERIELVTDGIVRTHFASRTPSKSVGQTNGHGRAALGQLIEGKPMITTVTAGKTRPDRKIHKTAIKLASTYDSDHYLVIREFQAGSTGTFRLFGGTSRPLDHPVTIARVYADGREEPIRGVAIDGLDRRALRDILAAGTPTTHVFRDGHARFQLTAPAVLLEEVEVRPQNESAEKPPPLASPLARDP